MKAQSLTDEQKQIFQERVTQKVEEFESGLKNVVNNQLSRSLRNEYTKNVLHLFIGEGDPYSIYDDGRKIYNSGVVMETSSVNRSWTTTTKFKRYLYKLYDPATGRSKMPYTKISLEFTDAVRVDNIERVGDHYECVAYFCQKFLGYRDGRVIYGDVTEKKIRCFINSIEIPTATGGKQVIWDAKLGDIYVLSTRKP